MRFYYFIAFVFISVSLAYLLNYVTEEPVTITSTLISQEEGYDFFMNDVDSTHFAINGETEYRLQAKRSTHYPQPDYTLFDLPNIIIYQEDDLPWYISSNSGRVEKDVATNQDRIELMENVILHHIDSEGETTNIYTEFLILYPNTKELSTELAVLIEAPGTTITGVGMTADLRIDVVNLLADVKSRYHGP